MSENKLKYRRCGDYLFPKWKVPASPRIEVGANAGENISASIGKRSIRVCCSTAN